MSENKIYRVISSFTVRNEGEKPVYYGVGKEFDSSVIDEKAWARIEKMYGTKNLVKELVFDKGIKKPEPAPTSEKKEETKK